MQTETEVDLSECEAAWNALNTAAAITERVHFMPRRILVGNTGETYPYATFGSTARALPRAFVEAVRNARGVCARSSSTRVIGSSDGWERAWEALTEAYMLVGGVTFTDNCLIVGEENFTVEQHGSLAEAFISAVETARSWYLDEIEGHDVAELERWLDSEGDVGLRVKENGT